MARLVASGNRRIAGQHADLMYRVDGARHLPEWTVDAFPGYRFAKPVRIGNAASTQHQLDVYGEVLDCLDMALEVACLHRTRNPLSNKGSSSISKLSGERKARVYGSREPNHATTPIRR